jgi:hypothetical protein
LRGCPTEVAAPGFPTRGRGRDGDDAGAESGSFSFGSLPESDDGELDRCFPIFGLFTPPMVTPLKRSGPPSH